MKNIFALAQVLAILSYCNGSPVAQPDNQVTGHGRHHHHSHSHSHTLSRSHSHSHSHSGSGNYSTKIRARAADPETAYQYGVPSLTSSTSVVGTTVSIEVSPTTSSGGSPSMHTPSYGPRSTVWATTSASPTHPSGELPYPPGAPHPKSLSVRGGAQPSGYGNKPTKKGCKKEKGKSNGKEHGEEKHHRKHCSEEASSLSTHTQMVSPSATLTVHPLTKSY